MPDIPEHPYETQVIRDFDDLALLLRRSPEREHVCLAVVEAAVALVDGCHHASVMVKDGDRYVTLAASDDTARQVDQLERATGQGPCLDAIDEGTFAYDADIESPSRWPDLAKRLVDQTPVRSMAGYRLMVDGFKEGALNVFSDSRKGLDAQALTQAAVLAAFATAALDSAAHQRRADTLQEGLESNRVIGVAIGLLMATHGIGHDAALGALKAESSRMNRKLQAVAQSVINRIGAVDN